MNLRGLLMDLDGTLADTAADLAGALNDLRAEFGRAPLPFDQLRPEVSRGSRGLLHVGFGIAPGDPGYDDYRQRFLDLYAGRFDREVCLYPGIVELLARCEALGLPWGIVTNKPARFTAPLLAHLGLTPPSGCVVTPDDVARPKPAPESVLLGCQQIGRQPGDVLFVGDARQDIDAGRAAGVRTAVALYGYLGSDENPAEWGADRLLESPDDIATLIVQTA